jgi:multiple sugar transport system permease protein
MAARTEARRAAYMGWGFLSPALLLLLLMTVTPTFYLVYYSLHHVDLLGPGTHFVGLANFRRVLGDSEILWSFAVTGLFVLLSVAIELALGLLLALMLARRLLETNLLTALFILPLGVAPVVSALVFRVLLDPAYGWIDYYLQAWGLVSEPIDWLGDPFHAWVAVIALDVWQWTPFVALILLAGLQAIPEEPMEAARLDGAGPLDLFWHITLPFLRPFIAIAMVFRAIEAFKTFASVQVLTGGGPGASTELVNLDLYRLALQDFDVGAAAALGFCFLVLLSVVMQQMLNMLGRNTDVLEE